MYASCNVLQQAYSASWCSNFHFHSNRCSFGIRHLSLVERTTTLCRSFVVRMVKLHLKQGDESLFLYETTCQAELSELIPQIARIQNGRLKIERLVHGR